MLHTYLLFLLIKTCFLIDSGHALLIENVSEELDSILDPILSK